MDTSELQLTQSGTINRIEQIVRDLLGEDDLELSADTRPADVAGWDSLANVSIVFGLEEEFGISFGDDVLKGFETIGQLAGLIESARETHG